MLLCLCCMCVYPIGMHPPQFWVPHACVRLFVVVFLLQRRAGMFCARGLCCSHVSAAAAC
jgi:hypothetical protein